MNYFSLSHELDKNWNLGQCKPCAINWMYIGYNGFERLCMRIFREISDMSRDWVAQVNTMVDLVAYTNCHLEL